jgi:hypothetical protein
VSGPHRKEFDWTSVVVQGSILSGSSLPKLAWNPGWDIAVAGVVLFDVREALAIKKSSERVGESILRR